MRTRYFEYNGKPYTFPQDLAQGQEFLEFVLAHGDEALLAARQMESQPEYSQMLRELLDQGLLEKVRGRFRLTPRAVNAMQRKALMEIFAHLKSGARDSHDTRATGPVGDRIEGTRPFQFGDALSEIDLSATLRNAIRRRAEEVTRASAAAREAARSDAPADAARGTPQLSVRTQAALLPLRLAEDDFELHHREARSSCSTVVLIDQSGSMARFGRYLHAKKCAMALTALIRQRFPLDTIDLVGFFSGAEAVREDQLPLLMPKPVSVYDPRVRVRVPLNKLNTAPQHFTNLHLGLLKAARLLQRRAGDQKLVFIITDGQPTAHVQGDYAYLIYPPHESSHWATINEAVRIARTGVRVCTFALTDDYWDMDWLGFVEQLGRMTRGVTFQCTGGDLSACVMESYLSGRRKRSFLS